MAVKELDTSALNNSRSNKATTENEIFLAGEKRKRLIEDRDHLKRHLDPDNNAQLEKLRSIEAHIEDEDRNIQTKHNQLEEINAGLARAWEDFNAFTNPKKNLGRLDEKYPILLMPLRIETRFKEITSDDGRPRHELWVRSYPDDCSIDTFEETPSESEIRDIETFWMDFWAAMGDESKRRAAWRYLADGHGYGRAQHIVNVYQPQKYDEIIHSGENVTEPTVYLIINGKTEIQDDEKNSLTDFWKKYYLASIKDDSDGMDDAAQELTDELGEERANLLINDYPPKNINQVPPPVDDNTELTVEVKYIEFEEDPDVQKETWSRAPKVMIMPERLYLLAFNGEEKVIEQSGNLIPFPLIVGPDPKMSEDELVDIPGTDIKITKDMRWMVDFDEAVNKGMGFKIELSPEQFERGFDRLFVLGVKMSSTRSEGKVEFEDLIKHHYFGNSGFSFLPVGTPTNNTQDTKSGYNDSEDADESYDLIFNSSEAGDGANDADSTESLWWNKSDQQWFCEMLGISGDTFKNTINTDGNDQIEARAMNVALWPATWGYFFETMLEGSLSDEQIKNIRWYFNNFVVGRGNIPSIRIDDQPYGILPTTAFSRMSWLNEKTFITPKDIANDIPTGFNKFLPLLNSKFSIIQSDWKRMSEKVSHVGSSGDPHQILLDILGLHGGSVEFYNRIGESFEHIYNLYLIAQKKKSGFNSIFTAGKVSDSGSSNDVTIEDVIKALGNSIGGRLLLNELGYTGKENPEILEKLFVLNAEKLIGPLIDDLPLSEFNPIRIYSNGQDGNTPANYLQWLISVAENSFEDLRKEEKFIDNKRPNALLYLMLKYSLEQSYFLTSLDLYRSMGLLSPELIRFAKIEPNFVHIRTPEGAVATSHDLSTNNLRSAKPLDSPFQSESRYNLLYQKQQEITGSPDKMVFEYIPDALRQRHIATQYLYEQTQALRMLANSPTARLERAFTEHLDCASYRFDAWKSGIVNYQLKSLRHRTEQTSDNSDSTDDNKGLYIGAYGWLENVRSENKQFESKKLPDDLKEIFNPSDQYPIHEDKSNLGYINAPSLNHAVTAAILRNGYEAYASEEDANMFNVNLSSGRVRKALKMIEGIQNGQSLAALLGYEFERGIHDNNNLSNVDQYVFKIRRKFPLASNQIRSTYEEDEDISIEKLEARNVVDGLDLIGFAESNLGPDDEPLYFDDLDLGSVSTQVKGIIVSEINNIRDINDAVSDLAFAESIHQVAQGNIDRAAGTLDTYSSGNYPQIPDVIQTPRSGVNLTHRVGIHIKANAPVIAGQTPRAMAEPGLNMFFKDVLPVLSKIRAYVSFYHLASDSTIVDHPVSMADLNLQPIDLLYMINTNSEQAMTALDDCIVNHVLNSSFPASAGPDKPPRPDTDIKIRYFKATGDDNVSIFELAPLIEHLKSLLLKSKPLKAGDVIGSDEASTGVDSTQSLDKGRIDAVMNYLESKTFSPLSNNTPLAYLDAYVAALSASLGEGGDDNDTIINSIDDSQDAYMALLKVLSPVGLPQAGTGFLTQWRKEQLSLIFKKITGLTDIWNEKEAEYGTIFTSGEYNSADPDSMKVLLKAERIISTETTLDPGNDPEAFRTGTLTTKFNNFIQKRNNFQDFVDTNYLKVSDALADLVSLLSYEEFYLVKTDAEDIKKSCLLFANELLTKSTLLQSDLKKRVDKVKNELFTDYSGETGQAKKVQLIQEAGKTLIGEEFKMIPSFSMPAIHNTEWNNALGQVDTLLDYQVNTLGKPLPMDDWFYGVARVRENLAKMERAMMLIEGFTDREIELTPVQFPRLEPYCWFGAEFGHPDEDTNKLLQTVFRENDHLLYTAYYHEPFNAGRDICGFLVDEWTEIIPTEDETTGIAFHYDRPNSEPPQTMLLAVSPQMFGEGWSWDDLVAILHETLDEARLRAVEPQQIENDTTSHAGLMGIQNTGYANLLPATISTVTKHPVSIMLNYAFNNLPITANIIADD